MVKSKTKTLSLRAVQFEYFNYAPINVNPKGGGGVGQRVGI